MINTTAATIIIVTYTANTLTNVTNTTTDSSPTIISATATVVTITDAISKPPSVNPCTSNTNNKHVAITAIVTNIAATIFASIAASTTTYILLAHYLYRYLHH